MEAYTRWQASAPWSMLAKSGLLSERERLPTMSLVFVLLPRGYRPQGGQFHLAVAGASTQQLWYREVCLWQQEPQDWWEESPGLMPLYPLCRHRRPRQAAIAHAARTIMDGVPDRIVRADLLTTLYIFGKLAYPKINVVDLIGREQMKESKAYEEIMAEGILQARREDISEAIDARFGSEVAAQLGEGLAEIQDPKRLSELHRLVVRCRRLTELRRAWPAALAAR